jgi:hypothetical protein
MKRIIFSIFFALFFFFPGSAAAQLPAGIEEQVTFELSPSIPEPNEPVSLRVTSFLSDLNKATITWYENGKRIEGGVGVREISFNSGDSGKEKVIKVIINKNDGGVLEKTFAFTPAGVNIVRHALTYAPSTYKGKAVATRNSDNVFVAIPIFKDSLGRTVSSEDIVFTWKINGTTDIDSSGVGKDAIFYSGGLISRPVEITVEASPVSSDVIAREIKTFNYAQPEVVFYLYDPSLGDLYNNAILTNLQMTSKELEVKASPFGFNYSDLNNLVFNWLVNGEKINNNSRGLTLRRTDGSEGSSSISLNIENPSNLLQTEKSSFNLFYNRENNF